MKVAVVGATGLVGQKLIDLLAERDFKVGELIPVASKKSIGKLIHFQGKEYPVTSMEDAISRRPDIALFSAGGSISLENALKFSANGTVVIDNSSAWRMDDSKKLIVPEVNGHALTSADKIIANPNCSTIQMVLALKPLHEKYKIKRVVVSTYQSVTGSGKEAVDQLMGERENKDVKKVYPYKIDLNAIPHIDVFQENGYTKEEMKMVNETKKIMEDDSIKVTATCVRIPTIGGHSESVNVEFENDFEIDKIKELLTKQSGITVQDDLSLNHYPMPLHAYEKDDVFVGRIRRDESTANAMNMWVVSDNIRKGAATNTIQIAEYLVANHLI